MPHPLRPVDPDQRDRYRSPWSLRTRVALALWRIVATLLFRPMPFNRVRLGLLRLFGARLGGSPFVHASARLWAPWNLTMEDRACIGAQVDVYNLAPVILRRACTVAQQTYLCTGTHDLDSAALTLQAAPIEVGAEAFLGARTFVLPGVIIGEGAVTGACAVVTKDVPARTIVAGNPARQVRRRSQ
ncbi:putative colanic acid biosynthesis acetyltransferase [bacterium]|nr:putative colanic acid biosynthesis acetyltransferase [bacterium]